MKRRGRWIIAGAVFLAAAGLIIYLIKSGSTVKELAELASQGGERELREPFREPAEGPRILIFALDGIGKNEFDQAILSGKTPSITGLLGSPAGEGLFEHGYTARDVVAILPSTTMAAWSSIFTGEPAARTGVPGNEWFARDEMRFYAPAPVSVTGNDHTLKMLTDGLVGNAIKTPTLYDAADLRSYVSLAAVYRGADLYTTPKPSSIAELFAGVAKGLTGDKSVSQEAYSEVDRESVEKLLEAIDKHGLANLQVVYFPGIDLYSHVADDPLNQQQRYLQEVLDPAIGQVLDAYEKRDALSDTYVIFIADHGHTPVLNDDRHSLATEGDDEPPALIEKVGFRIREFSIDLDPDEQDYQAALAYQGAIAYVYLADRSTCPQEGDRCDWKRGPRLEEDVMPVVRAFYNANETGEGVPQLKGTIDLIFAREPRPTDEEAVAFKVFDGNQLVPISDYLKLHPRPDLIRLEERLSGLAAGPYGHRAGDVLLLARSGLERPVEDRYYFSGLYRSWHGSPAAQDSYVPFVLARKADSGQRLRDVMNNVMGQQPSQLNLTPLVRALKGK